MTPAFAVASMVAAYASASSTATPRSFPLILGDDVSQNALSAFTGAFIYSVVALVALMNGLYGGRASQFILFSLTIVVLAVVLFMFIRWVDNIARLGRLGHTIDTVEAAAAEAIRRRFGGDSFVVAALPGTFCTPNRPVAWVTREASGRVSDGDAEAIAATFLIGGSRAFDQDPRFGPLALSEIASRALSPAVNDPGTAIDVTGNPGPPVRNVERVRQRGRRLHGAVRPRRGTGTVRGRHVRRRVYRDRPVRADLAAVRKVARFAS